MVGPKIERTIEQAPPEENLAKFLYDLGKVVFAALFIGSIAAKEKFSSPIVWGGLILTILLGSIALYIDRRK